MARKILTPEEKTQKALNAVFVILALQLEVGTHEIRKILGVGMNEITPVAKAVAKALKKRAKRESSKAK